VSRAGQIQQLTREFIGAAEQYGKIPNAARLERLRSLRLQIVVALLDVPTAAVQQVLAETLPPFVASYLRSGLRNFTRTPAEDEVFARCLTQLPPWQTEQSAAQGIAALLLAWHAFELKLVPHLASLTAIAKRYWLYFLCETPAAFVKIGDADKFALYLKQLCERFSEYFKGTAEPDADVINAFNGSSMFIQLYFNEFNLRDIMRARGAIIEYILERGGANLDQLRVMRPIRERPRIGYIALAVGDGTETVFLAANMEHLDHGRYDVRLYSLQEPAGNVGSKCRAAANAYTQLPGNIQQAVARLRSEDLDMAIFCTNLTAVNHPLTQIAAHRVARVQTSTIASPVTTGLRNMDVMISGEANETADSPQHYTERLVCLPGALNCYPFQYMLEGLADPGPLSRTALNIPENCTLFFSASNFYKILPELSQQWIGILLQVPDSYLLLMPFNPNWSSQYPSSSLYARLTEQSAGKLDLRRIRVVNPVPTIAHLHKIMALTDVYLDAFPFSGACSLYDAIVVGVPVVARAGKVCRSRHSKAILEEEGLGDWVTTDAESYERLAIAWGRDPQKRQVERERLTLARKAGFRLSDTAAYATKLMPTLDSVLSDWNHRVEGMYGEKPDRLIQRIAELACELGKRQSSFTDQNLVETIVLPYLRGSGSRRMIDVGACFGAMSKPFLEAGWQSILFEPDPRCHQQLADLIKTHAGRAQLELAAATAGQGGTLSFHLASLPGLSGLTKSPYAPDIEIITVPSLALAPYIAGNGLADVDFIKIDAEGHDLDILCGLDFKKITPRLIMVEFGDQFAGQDRDAIATILRDMRGLGYRGCIICLQALGKFERREWGTRLLTIGVDVVPSLSGDERLFGNILFFRDDDRDFLPSLHDWLEQSHRRQ
jgi:FkbM family methyltransferase